MWAGFSWFRTGFEQSIQPAVFLNQLINFKIFKDPAPWN
jgi:hypothetical protein